MVHPAPRCALHELVPSRLRRFLRKRPLTCVFLGSLLTLALALLWLFPGQRLAIAFRVATGVGLAPLQARIDELEAKAIRRARFDSDDEEFLADFYATLATGGKVSIIVGQTGRLMDHYLAGSGADYRLEPRIFSGNRKVQAQMALLRKRAVGGCPAQKLASPTFYMPDPSQIDSVFGLYYGTLKLETVRAAGACLRHWRAEVPWQWPSYQSLKRKYGDYHAESFPLPNLMALVFGRKHALYVDNGLGEYLVELGLAKPFLAFAEWDEAS